MNLRIKNPYLLRTCLKLREESWFGAEFFLSFVGIFIKSCLYYLVYRAVFLHSVQVDSHEITLYYILVSMAALAVEPAQFVAYEHMEDINSGAIIPTLLRPLNYPLSSYLNSFLSALARLAFNLVLMLGASRLLGRPMTPSALLLGMVSVLLGFTILYLIQAVIGCFAIWFHDITRFRDVIYSLLMMLGGRLLPSDLLFSGLKTIVYYTPLPYVYDIPVKVLMGSASWQGMGLQLLWVLLLGAVYLWLFQTQVRHQLEYGG